MKQHPTQPAFKDDFGTVRFKPNAIVNHLLRVSQRSGYGLNEIADHGFESSEWVQFAQLIGYSIDGFNTLSYVDDATYARAIRESGAENLDQEG